MRLDVTFEQTDMAFQSAFDGVVQMGGGGIGTTFIPNVSKDGILSWTNNGDLPNPDPVNIKGKDGINGKNGISATHSWNGTVLTIVSASGATSANLKGEKGEKGDVGPQGPKGDTGLRGEQGIPGNKGDTGASGYTPAKGIDYWTEADRTQMVADVIAALPVYSGEVV